VWAALPGPDGQPQWPTALAAAVAATRASGRGALVVVPDARDLSRLVAALEAAGVDHVALSAEPGRSARYRRFVLAATGRARVVVGTRAAALAPVADLGLVACWDDGDDLLAEPRAPYPHVREVLTTRADLEGTAAIVAGYARTPAAEQLVADGWAVSLRADRDVVRAGTPRVVAPSDVDLAREGAAGAARFPRPAWEATRAALRRGPVLVQVPRAGYLPVVACARCRTPSRCRHCSGPLALPARDRPPECRWCGRRAHGWACRECGGEQVRAVRVGSARTAEELGRAFPGVLVRTSGRDGGVLDTVERDPALVVATPGAEPVAEGGYAAAVLLDASVTAGAAGLDTSAEGLRRWLGAASLVRSDGTVVLLGNPPPAPAQALVRWDPVGYAQRELVERAELDFPPLSRLASLAGPPGAVRGLLARVELPENAQVLGPQPVAGDDGAERVQSLVRVPRDAGAELARALRTASAVRSAHKEVGSVRVQVDPVDIG
jgi:primosomal protein N' (replication factor Y) (superfamily II helicase)